jgi:hypothetical protein
VYTITRDRRGARCSALSRQYSMPRSSPRRSTASPLDTTWRAATTAAHDAALENNRAKRW